MQLIVFIIATRTYLSIKLYFNHLIQCNLLSGLDSFKLLVYENI